MHPSLYLARTTAMEWRQQTITDALPTSLSHCTGKLHSPRMLLAAQKHCSDDQVLLWPDCAVAAFHWQPNQQLQLTTHMALWMAYKGVSCFSLLRKREGLYHNQIKTRKKEKPFLWWSKRGIPPILDRNFTIWDTITTKLNWWQEAAMNIKAFERNYKLPTQL